MKTLDDLFDIVPKSYRGLLFLFLVLSLGFTAGGTAFALYGQQAALPDRVTALEVNDVTQDSALRSHLEYEATNDARFRRIVCFLEAMAAESKPVCVDP